MWYFINRLPNKLEFLSEDEANIMREKYNIPAERHIIKIHKNISERELHFDNIDSDSVMLFHGSTKEKWYSILNSGLRTLSDTKYMEFGKMRGTGIYLGNTYNISNKYSYGRKNLGRGYVMVCELKNHEKYKKDATMHVVTNDYDMRPRYLIL
jgi:hypothetical protein